MSKKTSKEKTNNNVNAPHIGGATALPLPDWKTAGFAVLLFIFLVLNGLLDNNIEKKLGLAGLIVTFAMLLLPKGRERLKERFSWAALVPILYIVWCAISTLYAVAGKLALYEISKIFAAMPVFLGVFLFCGQSKESARKLIAVCSGATALVGLFSVDAASCKIISTGLKVVLSPFTHMLSYTGGFETGTRITGILADPNLYSGVMSLGTLMAFWIAFTRLQEHLNLKQGAETSEELGANGGNAIAVRSMSEILKSKGLVMALALLAINTISYILAFSMGSLFFFAVSCVVMIIANGRGKRFPLFVLMAETAATSLISAFIAFAGLGKTGAIAFIPMLAVLINVALLIVLNAAVGVKISNLAASKPAISKILIVGLIAIIVIFAILAVTLTGSVSLAAGESISRAAYLAPGEYQLEVNATTPVLVSATSQSDRELRVHTKTDLLTNVPVEPVTSSQAPPQEISFTVPEDSEIVMFTIAAAEPSLVTSANYTGPKQGSLPLKYKLLPGFMANRLQNLFANENAVQRTVFFEDGMKLFKMSPLVGRGLGGFENGVMAVQNFFYETAYAHNHYIQALCDTGIIGLLLFVGMLAVAVIAFNLNGQNKGRDKETGGDSDSAGNRQSQAAARGFDAETSAAKVCLPLFCALLVQMYGQAFSDAVWSSGAWQILVFAVFALIAVLYGENVRIANKNADTGKTFTVGKAGYAVSLVLLAFFIFAVTYNIATRAAVVRDATFEKLAAAGKIERFEYADYKISYLQSAVNSPEGVDSDTAEKFAEDLVAMDSNSAYTFAMDYYFSTGQEEKGFAAAIKGLNYTKSSPGAWQRVFDKLEYYFDVVSRDVEEVQRRLENPENYNQIFGLYQKLQEVNSTALDTFILPPKNSLFIGKIIEISEHPEYWSNLNAVLNTFAYSMLDTEYAADADNNNVPDFIELRGQFWEDGDYTKAKSGSTMTVSYVPKMEGTYDFKVYCDNPGAVSFSQDQNQLPGSVDGGAAVTTLQLPMDLDGTTTKTIEITFSEDTDISRIVMSEQLLGK